MFTLASNPLLAVSLGVPGKLALEGKQFRVRAEGNMQTAGAFTAKASLVAALALPATPLTIGNWTLFGAGTARTVSTAWSPWWIQADLIFDSSSGAVQGVFSQMVNNLFDAPAALSNQLTGVNGTNVIVTQASTPVAPTDPVFFLGVALTFGTAGANVGNLMNFEIGF
jgi:hypothetical protein